MKYYALLDEDNPTRADNVILVSRPPGAVYIALFDHTHGKWISHPGAIRYLFGEESHLHREITPGHAAELAATWGATVPSEGQLEGLRPSSQLLYWDWAVRGNRLRGLIAVLRNALGRFRGEHS